LSLQKYDLKIILECQFLHKIGLGDCGAEFTFRAGLVLVMCIPHRTYMERRCRPACFVPGINSPERSTLVAR
jgi:hypothetical protein